MIRREVFIDDRARRELTTMMSQSQAEALERCLSLADLSMATMEWLWLFLSDEQAEGRACESVRFADLIFKEAKIGRRDIVRMADEERKHREV